MARHQQALGSGRRRTGGFLERQSDCEGCPLSFAFAFNLDSAAVKLYQMADDGQPQPQPAGPPVCLIALAKSLKHIREKLRRDALAGIAHRNLRFIALLREDDSDRAANRRKLDGV